ncbi:hypothetical protein [Hyphomicrobium sp.]|jgi:hypothetical protein|uniref:hypothetical protein n=1 Tax=Hyphomicrobium sp. TaxID=82 RepID=UPI0035665927
MATILEFKFAPRPTAASMLAACNAAASAEIVLFPGVRYERPTDGPDANSARTKRRREEPELES